MKYKVIKEVIKTGEKIECFYPRSDKNKVVGDTGHNYYFIEEDERPKYDSKTQYLEPVDFLDIKKKICVRSWVTINKPNDEIIQLLNSSLSEHLDNNYPLWKRIKHIREKEKGNSNKGRKNYIESLQVWEDSCRAERDLREENLVKNNIIPSFEWDEIPVI